MTALPRRKDDLHTTTARANSNVCHGFSACISLHRVVPSDDRVLLGPKRLRPTLAHGAQARVIKQPLTRAGHAGRPIFIRCRVSQWMAQTKE
ncbi:hypothetical protein K504DRAFT_96865 [Pleomassaria siparia CBS 279.74]|uniref:Uncharacterized protein n=1 Tax=Pleomassaria siparia CBS 279.74 TaxID=1314801 RepID=A0A6G1JY40_9PLEO|nr:hypothetical protein K504DRAFT_96865 [Pleomassaria siparia CBS 279.74]